MKICTWSVLAVAALTFALPAAAQEVTPGLTIVGHGPDVPNAGPDTTQYTSAAVEPPMVVVVVPVPIYIPRAAAHHHRTASSATDASSNIPNENSPTARFVNDPSRRFVNDPSRRFINPTVRLSSVDPLAPHP